MRICYAIFAGISLRSFRITFAAYLPTHIKSLRDFFQTKGTVLLVCICQRHTKRTVPLVCLWFVVYVVCLKSDMPHHQRQVRSTGIAKRLFFMFLFQSPSIFPLNPYLPTHIKFLTELHRIFFGTTCISSPVFTLFKCNRLHLYVVKNKHTNEQLQ